ncbi:ATP-binding protein [Rhizobium sp. Root1204]|uniref:ATP-dependent nuclease n=1 Tax=Rhizobium sp. Root1204 TaxID=1736428 RepID=UPI000713153E|nr:ATP-binding protein [Rhizobium sp. Root1204]KQV41238.1 ATP-dependent endonuclease [Rhizobium sp. Root1204]
MARIRKIEIRNFRSIATFDWFPNPGINCLIGPGDSGKSTILDAIDLCLGARRNIVFSDDDFYNLDTANPICIAVTLSELDGNLRSLETYGAWLRGFHPVSGVIEDEPGNGLETVLTVQLKVADDLEPQWSLVSERATAQGLERNLSWADRLVLSPTRLGESSESNLSWKRGSILNKVSGERADLGASLARAVRDARASFGNAAELQLGQALATVQATATRLGVPTGPKVQALLDAHSVSISSGTISLHGSNGVPLRDLGLGSMRLLIAGLQRHVAGTSPIMLADELEYGLEPHRIIALLGELGAKDPVAQFQVFVTTHSPVAVRELYATQLHVVRRYGAQHYVNWLGNSPDVQGTIRLFPDALLARSIVVCEGATEIGLLRGLDLGSQTASTPSFAAMGASLVDGGGDTTFARALAFQKMGYRTAILRDSDVAANPDLESQFRKDGSAVFSWRPGYALEDELFACVSLNALNQLIARAIDLKEEQVVDDHIRSTSNGAHSLSSLATSLIQPGLIPEVRSMLGRASRTKKGWFKSITAMEAVARDIVIPDWQNCSSDLRTPIDMLFGWMRAS